MKILSLKDKTGPSARATSFFKKTNRMKINKNRIFQKTIEYLL
jgi:hypothetical protein